MSKFGMILTNAGIAKVINAQMTQEKMEIVQFAVGDANGTPYTPVQEAVALRNEKWRGPVAAVEIEENNPHWIVVTCPIPAQHGGFMIHEAGLYDAHGDLIAIGRTPESYKPVLSEGASKDFVMEPIIEVSNASSVTLRIDPNVIQASRKYVDEKISAVQPYIHPIVQDLIGKRQIMAHRCAYFRLPENTLAGFYEASRMGVKYFETDFRRTHDGHHVCIHDTTTGRTSDTNLVVANWNLEDILKVRQNKVVKAAFYDNPPISTLDDILEFMRETGSCVNLNFDYGISDSDIPTVIQKIYEHNVQEQVILSPRFLNFDNTLCTTQTLPLTDEAFAAARRKGNIIAAYDYGYGEGQFVANTQNAMKLASKHNVPVLIWTVVKYEAFLALDKTNVNMMMVDDLWLRKDDVK